MPLDANTAVDSVYLIAGYAIVLMTNPYMTGHTLVIDGGIVAT